MGEKMRKKFQFFQPSIRINIQKKAKKKKKTTL